jgi:uncharacterized coiled-coil protein SlyX
MTTETNQSPTPTTSGASGCSTALVTFFRALVRLLVVLLFGTLIGAGIYFGVPYLYRQFVQPVEVNSLKIEILEEKVDQHNQLLNDQLSTIQERIASLEGQRDSDRQRLSELQSDIAALETALASMSEASSAQEDMLENLETDLASLEAILRRVNQILDEQNRMIAGTQDDITGLHEALTEAGVPIDSLRREIELVKAMELLTRARLSLFRNDTTSALEETRTAQALLIRVHEGAPSFQQEILQAIITRLSLAAQGLVDAPLIATEDLELAWQLLLRGLPETADQVEPFLLAPEGTPTIQAGEGEEVSPTPTVTPTP